MTCRGWVGCGPTPTVNCCFRGTLPGGLWPEDSAPGSSVSVALRFPPHLAAEWSVIERLSVWALEQSHQPVAMVRITPSYRECTSGGTNVVKSAVGTRARTHRTKMLDLLKN